MTIAEILSTNKDFLLPADVAPVLGVDAQDLRNQAHAEPDKLGFPVSVVGRRVLIPRKPFVNWLGI